MPALPRSNKPVLPPTYGSWLARANSKRADFHSVEYLRRLGDSECTALRTARNFFLSGRRRPEVGPLFEAYQSWLGVAEFVTGQARLGPPTMQVTEDRLMSFLLVWRMALDQLAFATSSRFGKNSREWRAYQAGRRSAYDTYFGYRVVEALRNRLQHQERPPLTQKIEGHPYICKKCGEEHVDLSLSVTLQAEWVLESENCPRILKIDLEDPANTIIDIREVVEQSMQGFDDLLYTLLISDAGASERLAVLVEIFDETSPDVPIIVKSWPDATGNQRGSLEPLSGMEWVITRAAEPLS
jgi:hypothetical protein